MSLFPNNGATVFGLDLKFPTISKFYSLNEDTLVPLDNKQQELEKILNALRLDSIKIDLKLKKHIQDSIENAWKKLQYPNNDKSILYDFFDQLDRAKTEKVRIMHFGDSQIEADRITSYVRNELQKEFGGNGAGLFAIEQVTRKMSVKQTHSQNWNRYAGFGRKKDTSIRHKKYGVLLAHSKYSPIIDSTDLPYYNAWVSIKKPTACFIKAKQYNELNIFYGNSERKSYIEVIVDSNIVERDSLKEGLGVSWKKVNFNSTPKEIKINFSGIESPDFYALSIESHKGVVMDNIPLRGASGTEFSKQDKSCMKQMFNYLQPSLLILEFGGNTIPYIKSKERAYKYGKWFGSQIRLLKSLCPNATILVIGPADMSKKEETKFITYPLLREVRNALKEHTFKEGGVFWDMYEAMGGQNTMPKWAAKEPPLASKDYIHFTSKGARKIAELFYLSLKEDYTAYKEQKK
jgi:lysophospholipase L1-like esterase